MNTTQVVVETPLDAVTAPVAMREEAFRLWPCPCPSPRSSLRQTCVE